MSKKVAVFLADGFEEVEAIAPIDLLRRAEIEVDTVSLTDENFVQSARKVKVVADKVISEIDFDKYDMLVLPGGPGHKNYFKSQLLLDKVLEFSKDTKNKKVGAICAAPLILSKLGILENKKAICFPACESNLLAGNPILTHEKVVVDGNIVTSRSAGTAIDFALEVISQLLGNEKSKEVKDEIVY